MSRIYLSLIFFCSLLMADINSGLLYYLSFDSNLVVDFAEGAVPVADPDKYNFTKGKVVDAIELINERVVLGNYLGNFNQSRGTVAFWISPQIAPLEISSPCELWRCGSLSLVMTFKNKKLYFMTASAEPPDGWVWEYNTHSHLPYTNWQAKQWYHVAISWDVDKKNKRLYIDGKLVSEQESKHLENKIGTSTLITLGSTNLHALFDEFLIWQRQLADNEILHLYRQGHNVAEQLKDRKKENDQESFCPLRVNLKQHSSPKNLVFLPGANWEAEFEIENLSEEIYQQKVQLILQDIWEKNWSTKEIMLDLKAFEKKQYSFNFQLPNQRSTYRLGLYANDFIKDLAVAAVWPLPEGAPDPESFFGNHVHGFNQEHLALAARLGLGWQRVHDMLQFTWWNRTQPKPGDFTWSLDHIWENTKKYQMQVLGCFIGVPYWAARDGVQSGKGKGIGFAIPPDLGKWRNHVRETVKHYKEDIKYWELFNEPAVPGFWRGSPEELTELVNSACEEIRNIDPQAQIMSAGFTPNSWRYHKACAEAGMLKQLDILSVHHCPGMEEPEITSRKTRDLVEHLEGLWTKHGPEERPFRLWSTESSIASTSWFRGLDAPGLPPQKLRMPNNAYTACKRIIQGVVIMQSFGFEKHFYYWFGPLPLGERSFLNSSMIDVTKAPRPKQLARMALAEQIDGKNFVKLIRRPEDGRFWAAVYQSKSHLEESSVVWWCGEEGKLEIKLDWSGGFRNFDMMGNLLPLNQKALISSEPKFLEIQASSAEVINLIENAEISVVNQPILLEEDEGRVLADIPPLPDYVAPSENPSGIFFVDLRSVCNMGFADEVPNDGKGGWADEGPMNDMRSMPVGKQTWFGVEFDIIDPEKNNNKSILTLRGTYVTPAFPEKVLIPMRHEKVRCLYFLHSASNGARTLIGEYIVRFASGKESKIDSRIPGNNGNWWTGYYYDTGEESKPVGILSRSTLSGNPEWRYLRIFEWVNPYPDDIIIGVEAISNNTVATPILLGITGVCNP